MGVTQRKREHSRFQATGTWIRADLRLSVYLRDGFRCVYCREDLHGASPREITLDHYIPRSRGGTNQAVNLITSCRSCNAKRKDRTVSEFVGDRSRVMEITIARRRSITPYRALAKEILRMGVKDAERLRAWRERQKRILTILGEGPLSYSKLWLLLPNIPAQVTRTDLKAMEKTGQVKIEREKGKSLVVTITDKGREFLESGDGFGRDDAE
jgi:predicted transcriptional regulator